MIYSLLLLVVLLAALIGYKQWQAMSDKQRKQYLRKNVLWVAAAILVLLVVMGKAHWLMAVLATLMALFDKIIALSRYVPLLNGLFNHASDNETQNQARTPSSNIDMTADQAAQLLGVQLDASEQEIILAHKKLMQKVHPDRGGTDALASQINQAKMILLAGRE